MQEYDLCCVGHITLDKVITPNQTMYMPGGTSFYCSHAIRHLDNIRYSLVASLAASEMNVVDDLRSKGVDVDVILSRKSLYFENIYGENQDDRTQRVLAQADPFASEDMKTVSAKVFLLGALTANDFSLDFVRDLSRKGLIAIDSQGYLRRVEGENVFATDWQNKLDFLQHVHFLKVNEMELESLTGESDVRVAAHKLYEWGVKEVVITLGSLGSIIYDGSDFYPIPAYIPDEVVDATGCGDTYMTGYLYKRALGADFTEAGKFGAAMATIKIEGMGPFHGSAADIEDRIQNAETHIPSF